MSRCRSRGGGRNGFSAAANWWEEVSRMVVRRTQCVHRHRLRLVLITARAIFIWRSSIT